MLRTVDSGVFPCGVICLGHFTGESPDLSISRSVFLLEMVYFLKIALILW